MPDKVDYNFDSMDDSSLKDVGADKRIIKITPIKTKAKEEKLKMPPRPVIEDKPERVVAEEKEVVETEKTSLGELGSRIDELIAEDADLRSTFLSMEKDKQEKIVNRLNIISKEYEKLLKQVIDTINEMPVSDIDPDTMSQEEILQELKYLQDINNKLRSEYFKISNDEVKVQIEIQLNKLNNRYGQLIEIYNNKNTKSL